MENLQPAKIEQKINEPKITVKIGDSTASEYCNALGIKKRIHVAGDFLNKNPDGYENKKRDYMERAIKSAIDASKPHEARLIFLSPKDLGFSNSAGFDDITNAGIQKGLKFCDPEIGPAIAILDLHTYEDKDIIIVSNPFKVKQLSEDNILPRKEFNEYIFSVHGKNNLMLCGNIINAESENKVYVFEEI